MPRDDRVEARLAMTMAEDHRVDFGTFLRRAREQRGVTLQQLAVTTKISTRVLEALERNDPSKLPGGIFSRAFVRAYASEVGLDPEVAVSHFVSAFPDESGADDTPSASSAVEAESFEQQRRVFRVALRILGVAAVAAVFLAVYYARVRPGAGPVEPAAGQAPAAVAVSQPPAAPPSQAPPAQAPESPAASAADGAQDTAPPSEEMPEIAQPAADAGDAVPAPGTQPRPVLSPQRTPLVVVLTTTAGCWLSISVDGTRVPSRTLNAGERIEFAVQRSITMTAGNAGALAISLNGQPARSLGGAGQVVTTTIAASGYEAFLR